jgi:tRNA A-37 threonylcarbamoyl transferase component Bud32
MDSAYLKKLSYEDLKSVALEMDIKIPKSKEELIQKMIKCFKEYENYKKNKIDKYEKICQIGNKGKEGITYLVKTKDNKEYAMKTFKKNKSSEKLKLEVKLQEMAAKEGISPKIIDYDTVGKYIVMEKMDKHLKDILETQNGLLSLTQQKQLISIFNTLDKAKVFHADSNILNYMYKNKKLYIIDFGMSKEIDDKLIKKLGTSTPNIDIMTLGFVLKLKEHNCPKNSYEFLLKYISTVNIEKFQLL